MLSITKNALARLPAWMFAVAFVLVAAGMVLKPSANAGTSLQDGLGPTVETAILPG